MYCLLTKVQYVIFPPPNVPFFALRSILSYGVVHRSYFAVNMYPAAFENGACFLDQLDLLDHWRPEWLRIFALPFYLIDK